MQMLCEWAQVGDQPWEERIAEWIEGSGCDAWVMKGLTQYPEEYAQHRIRETTHDTGRDQELYEGYMEYYRSRGVQAIHDGYEVYVVEDCCGDVSQLAHDNAMKRVVQAGAKPVTALSVRARSRFRLLPQLEYRVCTDRPARSAMRITVAAA